MSAPSSPFLLPSAAGLFLLIVAVAFAIARWASRRARERQRDEGADLRWAIAGLLEGTIDPGDLGRLCEELDRGVFWAALESLPPRMRRAPRLRLADAFGRASHVRAERRALREEAAERRAIAAARLGRIGDERTLRALRAALHRGPQPVSFAAALSLARQRDGRTLRWLLRHPETLGSRTRRARAAVLRAFGRGAHPALARGLARGIPDAGLRAAAIEALGSGSDHPVASVLEPALHDGEPEVRVAAARAIGRLRCDGCAAGLMAALRDDSWPVRAQAAWALGRTRAEIAVRPLAARLSDPAWWVRRHAAYALGELGAEGRRALRDIAYGSEDPYARDMALEVLGGGFKEYRPPAP